MIESNKNFEFQKVEDEVLNRPFMAACRDYEAAGEERWVLAWLTEEEAKSLFEKLKMYFT